MTLHVYTRSHQPATRFVTEFGGVGGIPLHRHWTQYPGNYLLPTSCCYRRRPAKNLTVQVYYDSAPFWCRPGTGCKKPSHRHRVTRRRLVREFAAGLSVVGLARKYGYTRAEIEARLRRPARRRRDGGTMKIKLGGADITLTTDDADDAAELRRAFKRGHLHFVCKSLGPVRGRLVLTLCPSFVNWQRPGPRQRQIAR